MSEGSDGTQSLAQYHNNLLFTVWLKFTQPLLSPFWCQSSWRCQSYMNMESCIFPVKYGLINTNWCSPESNNVTGFRCKSKHFNESLHRVNPNSVSGRNRSENQQAGAVKNIQNRSHGTTHNLDQKPESSGIQLGSAINEYTNIALVQSLNETGEESSVAILVVHWTHDNQYIFSTFH